MKLSDVKKLYDMGLSIHYLHPKSKRPIGNDWSKGPKKDWAELENSFEPSYNLGVRLGEPSFIKDRGYLACIDVDVKSPAGKKPALAKLNEMVVSQMSHMFPTVKSGRGGGSCHLYCVTDHHFKMITVAKEKDWEICIYSSGRQMVLPPSTHPDTGFKYVWDTPLDIKTIPHFDPSPWASTSDGILGEAVKLDFKAEDVNLEQSRLTSQMVTLIIDGPGGGDRSADLMSASLAMCRVGLTDNQILSVLSDPKHWISAAAYEHTRSKSRARAVKWLHDYTLVNARYETHPARLFDHKPLDLHPLSPIEVEQVAANIEGENNLRLPDLNGKDKKPKNTLRNMVHLLEHFMGGGLVAHNEFSGKSHFMKDTPYGGVVGREIANHDDLNLKHYVACHYGFEPSKDLCFEAHAFVARKYGYHPVRTYLEGLVWDGSPRLDLWLKKAFLADGPEAYLAAVGRKVLTAAVTRVFEPGCKFDYVMVLEGNQGEGKSMSLGILASRPWFTDGLGDIYSKDVVDQMMGKWIIELGELASIRGKENEFIKSFFTRQVDRVRMSYERRTEDFPRQSIFIGSTNASEYFSDETGNRRYWPVRISGTDRKWLTDNRDQIWAEAMVRYQLGEKLYLTQELEEVAKGEQEKRFEVDEWEHEIKAIVSKNPKGSFNSTELWRAINITDGSGHPGMSDTKRIGKIMRRIGFERTVLRENGDRVRKWRKR